MSSIFGFFQFAGTAFKRAYLEQMATALSQQGPDGFHLWGADLTEEPAGLGHLGMPVMPEEVFEQQPLVGANGHSVLVADARLDNRIELGTVLNIPAARARRLSDSALILEAYLHWNQDCVQHLLGDFVFIIWDRHARRLFCGRDHLGNRVLFYHRSNSFLAIASTPRALLALPNVPRRLNEAKLADFLVEQGDAASTFYEAIYRLPPAHTLTATADSIQVHPYWSLDSARHIRLRSDTEYVEAFRELFADAVRCRLRGADPVGAFLSGGLDSPSVAGVAARQLKAENRRLITFTAVPRAGFDGPASPGWYNDETPYVEAIRDWHDNIDVCYVRPEHRTPLDGLDRLYQITASLVRNPCNLSWFEAILERAKAQGIRVLLSGDSGNVTISYDGLALLPALALQGRWLTLWRELRARAASRQRSLWALFKGNVLVPLLPAAIWSRYRHWKDGHQSPWAAYSPINPAFAKEMAVADRFYQGGVDPSHRLLADGWALRVSLLTDGMWHDATDFTDAVRVGFGIEIRDPTTDKRLVEFCLAIPEEQYLRNGQDRYLIRRAMADILPPEVVWKTSRGAQAPDWYEHWSASREELAREMERLERSDTARRCLDLPRMRRLLENWPQGNWADPEIFTEYRVLLLKGIAVGWFIRWFEEGKPPPRLSCLSPSRCPAAAGSMPARER